MLSNDIEIGKFLHATRIGIDDSLIDELHHPWILRIDGRCDRPRQGLFDGSVVSRLRKP
jgi:hypothetical protein